MRFIFMLFVVTAVFGQGPLYAAAVKVPPEVKTQVYKSYCIVVAQYLGYVMVGDKVTYHQPPIARYKLLNILKGFDADKELKVIYLLDDSTTHIAPPEWVFKPEMMPGTGSRWILFLTRKDPFGHLYTTYHGPRGRWPASANAIDEVHRALREQQ